MKALDKRFIELKKAVVTHPFEEDARVELDDLHLLVKTQLSSLILSLEKQDTTRKLYTNSKSHEKDPIPYPLFKSKDDEDIHKFLKGI